MGHYRVLQCDPNPVGEVLQPGPIDHVLCSSQDRRIANLLTRSGRQDGATTSSAYQLPKSGSARPSPSLFMRHLQPSSQQHSLRIGRKSDGRGHQKRYQYINTRSHQLPQTSGLVTLRSKRRRAFLRCHQILFIFAAFWNLLIYFITTSAIAGEEPLKVWGQSHTERVAVPLITKDVLVFNKCGN